MKHALAALLASAIASPAFAQPISPVNKFAWGENVGFLNWHDAPAPDAPVVAPTHLAGSIWGENIGWVRLGSGGGPYANTHGANYGVNRDPFTGSLTGYAWGENIGWINFAGGALATPPNPARIEGSRFRGYAWGENIGWINLDDPAVFVALACACDTDANGMLNLDDIDAFVAGFLAQAAAGDCNADGAWNLDDIDCFASCFLAGCP